MQTFAPQARVSGNLSHALRASDVTQRRCHQGGVAFFERSLKVGGHVGVRLEVLGGIPRGSGIHTGVREEDAARSCLLVIIGVTAEGNKELVSIGDGLRESTASWLEVLRDLKARGLERGPLLAVGDGARGFWPRSIRSIPRRALSAAGCIRLQTYSMPCPRVRDRKGRTPQG